MHTAATKPPRRLVTVAILGIAAFSLVAAGCGDNDEETTASVPTTTSTGATGATGGGKAVKISETEFKLDPSDVKDVKAGSVTFDVTNDGETTHSLEVEGNGVEEELPDDLAPGDSGELTVDLDPGTYTMYCPIDDHRGMGMEGTITVK
ncbi:MAG TPA: cupredoxin domain-containing protein [Solirubrobacterales bacterium]|nr:cupredoxin domain-containing protein [Solirubrobacterales bacterium]